MADLTAAEWARWQARAEPWRAERAVTGHAPWGVFEVDPAPTRCPSVWHHDHGASQCELRAGHDAQEHHGRCAACYWDEDDVMDCELSWTDHQESEA